MSNTGAKTVQARREFQSRNIIIAYTPLIGNFYLKNLLGQFAADYPDINIARRIPHEQNLVQNLFSGTVDAIFTMVSDEVEWEPDSVFTHLMGPAVCRLPLERCSVLSVGLSDTYPLARFPVITRKLLPKLHGETLLFPSLQRKDIYGNKPYFLFLFLILLTTSIITNLMSNGAPA